jgi:hypothetical protein
MPNWDIFAAQQVLKHLTPAARSAGYVLSLYGSVLTDMAGDDLDVIACRSGTTATRAAEDGTDPAAHAERCT